MNRERRKSINDVILRIEKCAEILEDIMNEEQEALDNMPEGIANGERGQASQLAIDMISEAIDDLSTTTDNLSEISN